MDEHQFDDKTLSSDRLARMDPKERRTYLENRVYKKFEDLSPSQNVEQDSFFGASPPSIFVGRYGYPKVNAGVLSPVQIQQSREYDAPSTWYSENKAIEDVIGFRSNLVNSQDQVAVKQPDQFLDPAREVAIASEPVDIEVDLATTPSFELNIQDRSMPFGPAEDIESLELAENPNVSRAVEKAIGDDDWKAENAAQYLYSKDLDTYEIQRVLSAGMLGERDRRKLVPTRWSITATDDVLSKGLREDVKDEQELGEHRLFQNYYNGNLFNILLIPGQWEYELLEIKGAGSVWNPGDEAYLATNYENFDGRTSYADDTAGAYYAARLGVLEYLHKIQRQAKVLIIRDVTEKYWAPLGVWVIRETVRNAFDDGYSVPETMSQAIDTVVDDVQVSEERLQQASKMMEGTQQSVSNYF